MYYVKGYLVVKYDEYKNPSTTYDESDFGVCFIRQKMVKVDNVYKYYYDESGDVFDIVPSGTYGYLTYNQNQKMYYIDGKIVIKNVQTNEVLYILDESYGICYLADGITKYGVLLSYNFNGNREQPLQISNIQYLVNRNDITFSGKNINDYLDNTLTANTSFQKTLGISNKLWNLKDDEKFAKDEKYLILAKDTNELIGFLVGNKWRSQIYDNDGNIIALVEQNGSGKWIPGAQYGYPLEITEEGKQAKNKYYINNYNVDRIKFYSVNPVSGSREKLLGYFYTFDEYDWPTPPPPVPPEPTDDDITAICITNRELHLKKVKQPNKLGNLYIITTRAKKKK